jgi:hypothetical protein
MKSACLVIKYDVVPNIWCCNQCGSEVEQPNKLRINDALALLRGFSKQHQKCKIKWEKTE